MAVLALQGDFEAHRAALARAGAEPYELRALEDLTRAEALVLPGGESTVMGKLMVRFGLLEPIRERILAGMPVFGTCAGMILLARTIEGFEQPGFRVMDIAVERNAYGRQVESFEADVGTSIPSEPKARAVFIRAPIVRSMGPDVETLAVFEGNPVLVRQGAMLASSFHPELTGDAAIHRYFLEF